ncbi:hypothetical protein [Fodinicola feengrottensis]|uniref:hypothetical protein n=1 Tax=Fodinicola feengrottensis TaxID=435914 RepID=UPI0013D0E67F|nr:hypothetical protein [Fodinicola feengrottensis]
MTGAIAVSAKAGMPLYGGEKAAERSARTADFLQANAILPDGSTSYQLTADGAPVKQPDGSLHSSVYADLFVVLGLAGAALGNAGDSRCPQWTATASRVLDSAASAYGPVPFVPSPIRCPKV